MFIVGARVTIAFGPLYVVRWIIDVQSIGVVGLMNVGVTFSVEVIDLKLFMPSIKTVN